MATVPTVGISQTTDLVLHRPRARHRDDRPGQAERKARHRSDGGAPPSNPRSDSAWNPAIARVPPTGRPAVQRSRSTESVRRREEVHKVARNSRRIRCAIRSPVGSLCRERRCEPCRNCSATRRRSATRTFRRRISPTRWRRSRRLGRPGMRTEDMRKTWSAAPNDRAAR